MSHTHLVQFPVPTANYRSQLYCLVFVSVRASLKLHLLPASLALPLFLGKGTAERKTKQ